MGRAPYSRLEATVAAVPIVIGRASSRKPSATSGASESALPLQASTPPEERPTIADPTDGVFGIDNISNTNIEFVRELPWGCAEVLFCSDSAHAVAEPHRMPAKLIGNGCGQSTWRY